MEVTSGRASLEESQADEDVGVLHDGEDLAKHALVPASAEIEHHCVLHHADARARDGRHADILKRVGRLKIHQKHAAHKIVTDC